MPAGFLQAEIIVVPMRVAVVGSCSASSFPAVDRELAVDSALELQRAFESGGPVGGRVFVSARVRQVGEAVILDHRAVTLVAAEQRPRLPLALDDIVADGDGLEIAARIEAEEAVVWMSVPCVGIMDRGV